MTWSEMRRDIISRWKLYRSSHERVTVGASWSWERLVAFVPSNQLQDSKKQHVSGWHPKPYTRNIFLRSINPKHAFFEFSTPQKSPGLVDPCVWMRRVPNARVPRAVGAEARWCRYIWCRLLRCRLLWCRDDRTLFSSLVLTCCVWIRMLAGVMRVARGMFWVGVLRQRAAYMLS